MNRILPRLCLIGAMSLMAGCFVPAPIPAEEEITPGKASAQSVHQEKRPSKSVFTVEGTTLPTPPIPVVIIEIRTQESNNASNPSRPAVVPVPAAPSPR